jgi:cellulose synthase/poly-beta-1,6-N-acetylglucosamine synthase-like glycosyltransferase
MGFYWVDIPILIYFALMNTAYAILLILSFFEILNRNAVRMPEYDIKLLSAESTPPISVLVPAHNEEKVVVGSVRALLQLVYPKLQIIVINDGSTDGTLNKLMTKFDLVPFSLVVRTDIPSKSIRAIYQSKTDPRLLVVDKENGGKSDALNVGLNVARSPLVCCIDSDTIIDRHAFLRIVEPFIFTKKPVIATGGSIRLANGCKFKDGIMEKAGIPKSWLAKFQVVEYIRSFLFGRIGYNRLGGNLIISGAFGLFLREALVKVGGFTADTVGEDMEIIVRLHRYFREHKQPYNIVYIPDPICYTEAPEKVRVLGQQRDRWQRGLADSLWRHKRMFLNPFYGPIGMIVYPIFVAFELLGPVIELFGYLWVVFIAVSGQLEVRFLILFVIVAIFSGFLLSTLSLILNELSIGSYKTSGFRTFFLIVAFLENFGYRQLTLFFRLRGLLKYLLGVKTWGRMTRKGFEKRG